MADPCFTSSLPPPFPPQQVRGKYGDDWERLARMSIIEDGVGAEK